MLNDLLLLSGIDIPFEEAQIVIHQPTIKEIAYIGEEAFYTGCEFLRFSKDKLNEEDRIHLEEKTNFEIIMLLMREKNPIVQRNKICVNMVLSLMFPEHRIIFNDTYISLIKDEQESKIDNSNYEQFLEILNTMFCLSGEKDQEEEWNLSGSMAERIAEKLRQRHQKLAEMKGDNKVAILCRYVSILATGQQKDMNLLLNYTVYQIFDEFKRYTLKMNWDIYLEAKMAGAKDLKEVDDWMMDIHP